MSNIDLDLVELRCKLRGWKCERNDAFVYAYDGDARVATIPHRGKGGVYGIQAHIFDHPRLTLADIVASPPEGWEAEDQGDQVYFGWRGDLGLFREASIARFPDGKVLDFIPAQVQGEGRIAAHRAVAELLVLLGEVES